MTGRMLLGAIVGAVVLFVWGGIFWAVLPLGQRVVAPLPNEDAAMASLQETPLKSGVYYAPYPEDPTTMDPAYLERHKRGPIAMIFYRAGGVDPTDPLYYVKGFLYFLIAALVAAVLLVQAAPRLETYLKRAFFVLILGLFGAVVAFSGAVWWYQSLSFHLLYAVFNLSAWLLAGLAMAAVIKPQ